jgi:hypothetical protein
MCFVLFRRQFSLRTGLRRGRWFRVRLPFLKPPYCGQPSFAHNFVNKSKPVRIRRSQFVFVLLKCMAESEKEMELFDLYQREECSIATLGRRFGTSGTSAGGIVSKHLSRRRRRFTPEQNQKIIFLRYSEHLGVAAIATRFHCSESTIAHLCKQYEGRTHNDPYIHLTHERGDWGEAGRQHETL